MSESTRIALIPTGRGKLANSHSRILRLVTRQKLRLRTQAILDGRKVRGSWNVLDDAATASAISIAARANG